MKILLFIPIALGIIFLIWYVAEKIKVYSMKALYIKIAVSLCFIATALAGLCSLHEEITPVYGVIVIGGLVFGLLGDVVLDLKYIDLDREEFHTKSGFIFFGIGHVLFITAMFLEYGRFIYPAWLFLLISLVIGFAGGFFTAKQGPLLGNDYGEYFGIVAGYCGILASAVVMAVLYAVIYAKGSGFACPQPGLNYMSVGLVCFLISDLILSRTYFGKDHHKPIDIITNYIFYYAAQFLIALSVSCSQISG